MDLIAFQKRAEWDKKVNKKFLFKLYNKDHRKLDEHFQNAHEEVFEKTDCLKCGNCCKTTSPVFKSKEIEAIAKYLKTTPAAFIQKYLHVDSDQDFVLNEAPCSFLDAENYCLIYSVRPNACKEYPHTNRKKMFQLLDLTAKNTLVCPAVLEIVEKLKKIDIK